jgi:hypothetical protein
LSPTQIHDFVLLGLPEASAILQPAGQEVIETRLGKFPCRRALAIKTISDHRSLTYQVWRSAAVPFGWVRFEVRERVGTAPARVVFSASAVRTGQGAHSDLDESLAK